jgi:hypothetical protein
MQKMKLHRLSARNSGIPKKIKEAPAKPPVYAS